MKKLTEMKPGAKKQILGGMVYIALAVTVVAVTVGSVVTYFSEPESESVRESGDKSGNNGSLTLELPDNDVKIGDFNLDTPVSDNPSGVDAQITEPNGQPSQDSAAAVQPPVIDEIQPALPEKSVTESGKEEQMPSDKTQPVPEEPEEAVFEYGYDGFIKPCSGYVSKEFSVEIPVYSVSMSDYRAHKGIDIVNEVGTPVKATSNGVISDIYDDYLYGTTVVIEHKDGIKSVYSNLSSDLPVDTVVGRTVITGEIIAGIGESAVCEAAEAKHLHFELLKDGIPVNPEEYLVN